MNIMYDPVDNLTFNEQKYIDPRTHIFIKKRVLTPNKQWQTSIFVEAPAHPAMQSKAILLSSAISNKSENDATCRAVDNYNYIVQTINQFIIETHPTTVPPRPFPLLPPLTYLIVNTLKDITFFN